MTYPPFHSFGICGGSLGISNPQSFPTRSPAFFATLPIPFTTLRSVEYISEIIAFTPSMIRLHTPLIDPHIACQIPSVIFCKLSHAFFQLPVNTPVRKSNSPPNIFIAPDIRSDTVANTVHMMFITMSATCLIVGARYPIIGLITVLHVAARKSPTELISSRMLSHSGLRFSSHSSCNASLA